MKMFQLFFKALYWKTAQASGLQDSKHSWEEGHSKGAPLLWFSSADGKVPSFHSNTSTSPVPQQKLKDVAFPQAEILKKALLRRFEQEYADYLVKKVKWSFM